MRKSDKLKILGLHKPKEPCLLSRDNLDTHFCTLTPFESKNSAFTPYGKSPYNTVITGFKGEIKDNITESYLFGNGYRLYSPSRMRFNSPDSFSPFGAGGLNAYAFCLNDPINRSDPTGHFPTLLNFLQDLLPNAFPRRAKKTYTGQIIFRENDVYAFVSDKHKEGKLPKIYIVGHGLAGDLYNTRHNGKEVVSKLSPKDIYNKLVNHGFTMEARPTKFLSCYSASAAPTTMRDPVARAMTLLTGAKSTGAVGILSVFQGHSYMDLSAHVIVLRKARTDTKLTSFYPTNKNSKSPSVIRSKTKTL